jgi:hypothetical protein
MKHLILATTTMMFCLVTQSYAAIPSRSLETLVTTQAKGSYRQIGIRFPAENQLLFSETPYYMLASRIKKDPRNPALLWAKRVLEDATQPEWKKRAALRLSSGKCDRIDGIRMTHYQPNYPHNKPHYDPLGGSGGPSWGHRKYVRTGDVAASRAWPFGTVFYSEEQDCSLIVTDRGGAVRSRTHLDVCVFEPERAKSLVTKTFYGRTVWVLGRVTRKEAK